MYNSTTTTCQRRGSWFGLYMLQVTRAKMFVKQALKTEKVKTRRLGYWPVFVYRIERHATFKRFMSIITWAYICISFWEVPSYRRAVTIHAAGGAWQPGVEIVATEICILAM